MAGAIIAARADSDSPYYVYILRRPDKIGSDGLSQPFYVGCGKATKGGHQRVDQHEIVARRGAKSHRCSIIRKLTLLGMEVVKEVESWHASVDAVFAREREVILAIGRRSIGTVPLTNGTAGGEGCFDPGPDTRELMRRSQLAIRESKVAWGKKHAARTIPGAVAARSKRWKDDPEFQREAVDRMVDAQKLSRKNNPALWSEVDAARGEKTRGWIKNNREQFEEINRQGREAARQWALDNPELAGAVRKKAHAAYKKWAADNPERASAAAKKANVAASEKRNLDIVTRTPVRARCKVLIRDHKLVVTQPRAAWTRGWLEFEQELLRMIAAKKATGHQEEFDFSRGAAV